MPAENSLAWKLSWTLVIVAGWFFIGGGLGWVVAEIIHEHGSIAWFFIGMFLGVIVGLCHALFFLLKKDKPKAAASNGI